MATELEFETIQIRTEGRVLFARFNNPPVNIFGASLASDLVDLMLLLESTDTYRVVVFSSADPDYFISGVDLGPRSFGEIDKNLAAYHRIGEPSLSALFRRLSESPAVTIAQVEGRTGGAGSEFVVSCDMSFASEERAVFAHPELALGVFPGASVVGRFTRTMGRSRALEVLLGAEDFNATVAAEYGWINRALPDAVLELFVARLAHRIASISPEAILTVKDRVNRLALPTDKEVREDNDDFKKLISDPVTQQGLRKLFANGFQTRGRALGELELL